MTRRQLHLSEKAAQTSAPARSGRTPSLTPAMTQSATKYYPNPASSTKSFDFNSAKSMMSDRHVTRSKYIFDWGYGSNGGPNKTRTIKFYFLSREIDRFWREILKSARKRHYYPYSTVNNKDLTPAA